MNEFCPDRECRDKLIGLVNKYAALEKEFHGDKKDQPCDGTSSTDAVSWSSSAASTCKYSDESGGDSCSTAYASLDNTLGSTTYTFNSTVNCGSSKTYVIKCQDNSTSAISNCLEITHQIEAGGGEPPLIPPKLIIGGTGTNVLLYNGD